MPDYDVVLGIGLQIGQDLLNWWRERSASGLAPPTDDEVIARVKNKIKQGDLEGEDFEKESGNNG